MPRVVCALFVPRCGCSRAASLADVLTKPVPEDLSQVTRQYMADALPQAADDIIKYIATNKLLSVPTDLPLQKIHADPSLPKEVVSAWEFLKLELLSIGEDRTEKHFDLIYDPVSGSNLAIAIEL